MIGRRLLPLAVPLTLSLSHAASAATTAAPDPSSAAVDPTEEPADLAIPPATDLLSGHLQLSLGGHWELPFSQLDTGTAFRARAEGGVGLIAHAAIGISRQASLGVWGQYATYGEASRCVGCDRASYAVGPFLRYHLAQGFRLDPWLSLGAGYRALPGSGTQGDYAGIDWLRVGFGADWYALSQVGFGPYAQLAFGTFTKHPDDQDSSVYAMLALGLRISFDAQGK